MKALFKALGLLLASLAVLATAAALYAIHFLPRVSPADQSLKIEASPARLKRGQYLALHLADCYACHSQRDYTRFGAPAKPGSGFAGGEKIFDQRIGLPGSLPPKNLTPYNLKHYSDGELVRVLRTGVRKNGEPLFPMMPYQTFADMEQEDLYSVIVYLRSLPEVKNDVPEHKLKFPVNLFLRSLPKDAGPYPKPVDRRDSVAYGAYLTKMASCTECHTTKDGRGRPKPGLFLAGGWEIPYFDAEGNTLATGKVRPSNLTPDNETGIGLWTKKQFVASFQVWRGKGGEALSKPVDLAKGEFQTIMPWRSYAGVSDEDLGAIYDYLRTIPPVKNTVVKFTPPEI